MDESETSRVLELYTYKFLVVLALQLLSFLHFVLRLVNFFIETITHCL